MGRARHIPTRRSRGSRGNPGAEVFATRGALPLLAGAGVLLGIGVWSDSLRKRAALANPKLTWVETTPPAGSYRKLEAALPDGSKYVITLDLEAARKDYSPAHDLSHIVKGTALVLHYVNLDPTVSTPKSTEFSRSSGDIRKDIKFLKNLAEEEEARVRVFKGRSRRS